ncbi:MAG: Fic family protein, partial [Candidatus Firestonebacteria bacterium]
GSKTEQVEKAVARFTGPFSISDLERACAGISRVLIKNVLSDMNRKSAIVLIGKGRGAKWTNKGDRKG